LRYFKKAGAIVVNYNPDHPFEYHGRGSGNSNVRNSIKLYDVYITYSREIKYLLESKYNVTSGWLPFGYDSNTEVTNPIPTVEDEILKVCFVGMPDKEIASFIEQLISKENVIMHGVVHPKELAIQFQRMDAFLICYDILEDQSKGTNYHKVMEYLSTGKVVISNNISTYQNLGLIEMNKSRIDNKELPELFIEVVSNFNIYNNDILMKKRREFALENSYSNKITEIEKIIYDKT